MGSDSEIDPPVDLWADDRLGRRAEAEMLQHVLVMEAEHCGRAGNGHAYVLGLDAAYGEGKTFFLTKLRKHLAKDHPVAFVDAWVDDTNEEPLLAIMAAINEALEPFLQPGGKTRTRLKGATAAALPIIGKVAVGAATTFFKKYFGDEIPNEVSDLVANASQPTAVEEVLIGTLDATGTSVSELLDKAGAELLATYKARQKSRGTFKSNMAALVNGLSSEDGGTKSPLFIVIDELDRCRPDYAIKVLEEVKHLFDVAGVVFIIAIHGDQLEKSIAAVYGAEFDAKAYLHRFFSRRYKLRRLSMKELVANQVAANELDKINWNYPSIANAQGGADDPNLVNLLSAFCSDYTVTPRELAALADGLRIFAATWEVAVPIELVFLLGLLLRVIRADDGTAPLTPVNNTLLYSGYFADGARRTTDFRRVWEAYDNLRESPIYDLKSREFRSADNNMFFEAINAEITIIHKGSLHRRANSVIDTYPERVRRFGRILE